MLNPLPKRDNHLPSFAQLGYCDFRRFAGVLNPFHGQKQLRQRRVSMRTSAALSSARSLFMGVLSISAITE